MITKLTDSVVTRTIAFDTENRISSMSDGGSYVYDPSGQRIKKTEGSVTTYYFFANYEEEHDGATVTKIKYYFANDLRVAQYSKSTGLHYYHSDHLSSAIMLTDEEGRVVQSTTYGPFGATAFHIINNFTEEELIISDPITASVDIVANEVVIVSTDISGAINVTITAGDSIVFKPGSKVSLGTTFSTTIDRSLLPEGPVGGYSRYQYTGQEKDSINGLYYYGARYYDPELGRFTQPDTLLDGLNRYAYCHNNPVKYVDPTGHNVQESETMYGEDYSYGEHVQTLKKRDRERRRRRHERESEGTGVGSGETNWTDFFNWKKTESNPNINPQVLSGAGGIEYIEYDHPFAVLASGFRSLQSQNGRMGGGTLIYREDNGEAALSVRTLFVYRKAGSNDIDYYRIEKTGLSTSNHPSTQGQGKDFTITTANKSEADKILLGNRYMIIEAINTNPSTLQRIAQTMSSFWARVITSSISY